MNEYYIKSVKYFMLCCIHTSNLRIHSILTVYEKKSVEVSVRENFGVVVNSFSQFHSTFIRNHSRFFVRVGHETTMYVLQSLYLLVAVTSSGILKVKQKLTFNSDKLGRSDFITFSKLTMCRASEA
jgi:hypothetical protein